MTEAMVKHTQAAVRYTDDHGTSDQWCGKCRYFIAVQRHGDIVPSRCEIVRGAINRNGWCELYKGKT